ncbi:hypothetical protein AVEN_119984-1 [Araneus ventricosus]|nr:hypothetical protein AVEN_119984-1 [Araneus ventricosus]
MWVSLCLLKCGLLYSSHVKAVFHRCGVIYLPEWGVTNVESRICWNVDLVLAQMSTVVFACLTNYESHVLPTMDCHRSPPTFGLSMNYT